MKSDKFYKDIADIEALIKIEERKVIQAKNEIRRLEDKKACYIMRCDHKYENGESAIEDTSHWVSDIHYYECDWTGEELEEDNGYTEYEFTCKLCYKKVENYER